MLVDTGD
nr:protein of unknown function [Ralstonia solanacearum]